MFQTTNQLWIGLVGKFFTEKTWKKPMGFGPIKLFFGGFRCQQIPIIQFCESPSESIPRRWM